MLNAEDPDVLVRGSDGVKLLPPGSVLGVANGSGSINNVAVMVVFGCLHLAQPGPFDAP